VEVDQSVDQERGRFATPTLEVENIGGIDSTKVSFTPGVTLLTGENATNRTSLLRALGGAIGGSSAFLKRDSDVGRVAFEVNGTRYEREYQRNGGSVNVVGDPYTDDETIVDLFVTLLEDNPIRRAIRGNDDLTELLLAPIDTDELEREIEQLRAERDTIDERLTEIDRERKRLPNLEEKREELRTEIAELETELEDVQQSIEAKEDEGEKSAEVEALVDEIETVQSEIEETKNEIRTQSEIKSELQKELNEVREELTDLDRQEAELAELNEDIERLQGRESELSATINELSTIVNQNQSILGGEGSALLDIAADDDVYSSLDPSSQSLECWTCGNQVERGTVANRLEDLEDLVASKRDELNQVRQDLSDRKSARKSIERTVQKHERLTEREQELKDELNRRTSSIDSLESRIEELRDDLTDHQQDLEQLDTGELSDDPSIYETASQLEYQRGSLEKELRGVEDEIDEIEYLLSKYDDLERRRDDISERLTTLRSKVEKIEKSTVETFNTHMDEVLEQLQYDNIERVWLERHNRRGETSFELHVVREDEGGSVYEDAVTHLSESEREVVGLVVSLAGYLAHDVARLVPLIILDSLEAIDAERIAELTEYFSGHTDFLILALLEEDARHLPDRYARVAAQAELT